MDKKLELEEISDKTIEVLPLTVRTFNSLRRNSVLTVKDFLNCSEQDFREMKNLGKKSAEELIDLHRQFTSCGREITQITSETVQFNHEVLVWQLLYQNGCDSLESLDIKNYRIQFLNKDKVLKPDIDIEDVSFSIRIKNVFKREQIRTLQQLLTLSLKEIQGYPNMGKKSCQEIIDYLCTITRIEKVKLLSAAEQIALDELLKFIEEDIKECPSDFERDYFRQRIVFIFEQFDEDGKIKIKEELISNTTDLEITSTMYRDSQISEFIENYMINIIEKSPNPLSEKQLQSYLPKSLEKSKYFFTYLEKLLVSERIELFGSTIKIKKPSILEYISSLKNDSWQQAVLGRVQGKTLEEIGTTMGITRERVRQIVAKILRQKPNVWENDYLEFIQEYTFSKKVFIDVFGVDSYVYEYVSLINGLFGLEKHESTKELSELLYDERLTLEMKQRLYRELNKNTIRCDEQVIQKNRLEILLFTIKKFAQQEIEFFHFYDKHSEFLKQYELDPEVYSYPERSMENVIARQDTVVWKYGRKLRYYPMKAYDFQEFLRQINWYDQKNIELSAYKFYRDFPEVMTEYDIQDEYELHSILKKLPSELIGENVVLGRMPYIQFGDCNREKQALELMYELAPIARADLAKAFEELYGHLELTISSYFSTVLDDYLDQGIYRINELALTTDEILQIKPYLSKQFYFIDEFKKIFETILPNADIRKINGQNLRKLGYRRNSSYLYPSTYTNANAFFYHWLAENDSFSLQAEYSRLWNIQSFAKIISDARKNLDVIEHSVNYFIPIRYYEQYGVFKVDLQKFIDGVVSQIGDEYFTIYSLRQEGILFPFDEYDFNDWTYASLLSQHEKIQSRRFKNTILLKQQSEQFSLTDFVVETMQKFNQIKIQNYIEWVAKKYQLELNRERLVEVIKSTGIYYDTITTTIYATSQQYEITMEKQFFDFDDNTEEMELFDLDEL